MPAHKQASEQTSRVVACPNCGGNSLYSSTNPWRPFCSERCKQIDFGAWSTEDFRVAVNPDPDPDDESDS